MQNILVLGAGQSATYLIRYLLENAREHGWFVTVGDRDQALAAAAVDGHPSGNAITFDVNDADMRSNQIANATLVVSLLPHTFQALVANTCLHHGRHMISASYKDRRMDAMAADAQRKGILFLTECGLDPGIDIMSAMETISRIRADGGVVESFESYGSGVPAPDAETNPLRYCITWNPRNVAMAGENGAQYLDKEKIKIVPWHSLFHHSWLKEVPAFGPMEAYPNRDSLAYRDKFGLDQTHTLIRGTLRYPGWSETWHQIVRLGLPNESIDIPDLGERAFCEVVEMFLPQTISGSSVEWRTANYLGISMTGRIMENFRWLGLFDREPAGIEGRTAADALIWLLKTKLVLPAGARDAVILLHDFIARYPEDGDSEKEDRRERLTSTLVHYGDPQGTPGAITAMARTVGMPAGIAAKLVLTGEIPLTGCHIPIHPAIYEPILKELAEAGLVFQESREPVEAGKLPRRKTFDPR